MVAVELIWMMRTAHRNICGGSLLSVRDADVTAVMKMCLYIFVRSYAMINVIPTHTCLHGNENLNLQFISMIMEIVRTSETSVYSNETTRLIISSHLLTFNSIHWTLSNNRQAAGLNISYHAWGFHGFLQFVHENADIIFKQEGYCYLPAKIFKLYCPLHLYTTSAIKTLSLNNLGAALAQAV
jgi:hypothetical protein